ncbi:sensor domain-containing diguanylate cyclase [Paenibacillus beijingensis]|uniref:Diguanylate cyclase n=1 Tax=Paenibacillus beijingensis TaxID=1126833 RepID=A0A0D5NDN0_9BACL|nr:GGDEF domain-containing protein [Paenibacillus beijingensis]AJY73336.1 diguanylate cyclase [Paenibacillus beijingensis]
MTIWIWLAGPYGQLLSSACVITVLLMMEFMAFALYKSYRKHPVHRLLIGALPLMIIQQALLAWVMLAPAAVLPELRLLNRLLGISSFIIINFVFMKLYSRSSAKLKTSPFILMLVLAFVIAAVNLLLYPQALDPSTSKQEAGLIGVDFFCVLIIFLILIDTRFVDISTKYSASLMIYFASELTRVTDSYIFHGSVPMLLVLGRLLPAVYITLLFLLLFEWVIDRLLLTYRSSITDGLTGLYNRKYFGIKAEQLLRQRKQIAVIFCDIDNFKQLNDTQGHHKADGVLKQVADIIREECIGIGSAGRFGGEELVIVIGGKDKPQEVAEKVRKRIESETNVTVSIGVSYSKEGMLLEEVVKQADDAMYTSKMNGKNKVTMAAPSSRPRASRHAST